MLMELHIRNFALIDSIDLEFYDGLNIFTGETGAGKSIVIDSVNFILGDKQSKDIIRNGQNSAFAEAVFTMSNNEKIVEILSNNGIETADEEVLIISREINQSGRSVSRVNGRTVTIGNLKLLSSLLIDIHGQHEHQSLLDENSHIEILDSFCNKDFKNIKNDYIGLFYRIKEVDKELEKLKSDEQLKLRKIDLLKFQIEEIKEAELIQGEDEELKKRKDILINSEKIYNNLNSCYKNLYEGDEKGSAYDEIGLSISGLDNIEKYDDEIKNINGSLKDVYYKLEDLIDKIRKYRGSIEFDEQELNDIDLRLDLINTLKRKYGNSITAILDYYNEIMKELEFIEKSDEIIEALGIERKRIYEAIQVLSAKMTKIRHETAKELSFNIQNELTELGMLKAVFLVDIKEVDNLMENGMNKVAFKISANPGEPPKDLIKVASGGEMSRIMLAIKNAIADIDKIPTLIFDEIDTGISGRTAQAVAEKMSLISKKHQLLCVTHLPQIAAMADVHFKIEKIVNADKTTTIVKKMGDEEQVEELARMLGGAVVTNLTREHSKEMIKLANIIKHKI
jgi:DNA repair protein RecN (Recombination protein N)